MKINQDFGMAIQTIHFLKEQNKNDYIQAGEIAQSLKFSVGYLQKVIQMLSRHGILDCKRGRIGGVRLRAKVISLLDLWQATCGKLDFEDPPIAVMKKPIKAFADSMSKVIIYKEKQ